MSKTGMWITRRTTSCDLRGPESVCKSDGVLSEVCSFHAVACNSPYAGEKKVEDQAPPGMTGGACYREASWALLKPRVACV